MQPPEVEKRGKHTPASIRRTDTIETVADNGSGVPEDVRAHVFEPFFTTKDQGKRARKVGGRAS
jgi:signal transduction histidine kinase